MYQSPQTDIKEYLHDDLNIELYKILTKDKGWKGLFDPLDFFNMLYHEFEIFNRNHQYYSEIEKHFGKPYLRGKHQYFFLYALIRVINSFYPPDISQVEPAIGHSIGYINELYEEIGEQLFPKATKPAYSDAAKYNFEKVKAHLKTLKDTKGKIIYLTEISTEYKQASPIEFATNPPFDKRCDLEIKKMEKLLSLEHPPTEQIVNSQLGTYTNGQIVLIFYYFYEYCKLKTIVIDKTTLAKFIHLVVDKEFTTTTNSDIYNKLSKAPNFGGDKKLIENLEIIKPLFEKVKLDEIVKMINNELITAHKEKANR
jgi:hypothetical protein